MENDKPYKEGTIKLTWIDPANYNILKSEMFNSVEEALKAKDRQQLGKNWLLFELGTTDGNKYSWNLLPYGKYNDYVTGMKIRDNVWLRIAGATLTIMGVIYTVKLLSGKR
jgi:hypothetical protein